MSERVPSLFSQTQQIDDAVTLFANRQVFEGWEEVSITRQLNSIASSFSLGFTDKWRVDQESWRLRPGDAAHIHIGKTSVVNGFIDKLDLGLSAQQRTLNAAGRSKTGDLVDCSITGQISFKDLKIDEIVTKLIAPFGLKLLMQADAGPKFDKIVFRQGETVFEAIDRLARERSLIMMPSFEGNLILTKKGTLRCSTELRQGINIISGSASFDNTDRFSEYTVKGQGSGGKGTPTDATQPIAKATDAGIARFRPLVVVAENAIDNAAAIERAKYEANIKAAKASRVTITTQGWFERDGSIWDVNKIVSVDAGFLGVRQDMLIEKVTYNKSNGGTICELELIRSDAFEFDSTTVSKTKDPVDLLGWEKA